ncbi:unknown protein [Seminavis robusta]|uniref:Uncharacterized protein n=1 Tax=Seminavis robusta TaxID=568900 RepID=A0A9N8DFS4_9STRA|nr:unknown protein [Seminavis robusta]|eukprot:Sro104_g052640.1 n/a (543) ;mRNA; r:6583-8211
MQAEKPAEKPKKPKGRKKDWVMEAGAGVPPPEKPSPTSSPELVAGWYPTHPDMTGRLSYSPDSDELELARAVAEAQAANMQKTARKKATLAAAAAAENRLFDCTQEKFLNEMDAAALADATAGSKAKTPQAAAASWNTPPTNTSVPVIPRAPAPRQFAPVFHPPPAHWHTPAKNDDSAFTMQSATWPTVTGQEESVAGRNGRHSAPPMLPSPTKWSPETQAAPAKKKAPSVKPNGKPKAKKMSAGGGDSHFTDGEVSGFFDILERRLPIGKEEFTKCMDEYNALFPDRPRGYNNLKAQFNKHASKKPPTGDPDCPPLTKRAKRIKAGMKEKAGMLTMANIGDGFGSTNGENLKKKNSSKKQDGGGVTLSQPKSVLKTKARDKARDGIVQAIIASDKAQAKREERAAKRRGKQMERTMMVATQAFTALATAMAGQRVEIPPMQEPAKLDSSSSSSDSSLSSLSDDSDDGGGGKKLSFKRKLKRWKKKKALKRARKSPNKSVKKKKEATVDLMDVDSSSGSEVELKLPYGKHDSDDDEKKPNAI